MVVVDVLVPEGSTIYLEPSIVNLNENLFGRDSETFDPQRWLTQPALVRQMGEHMISFGAGAAHCPGQHLHTTIITKLLTQIIPHFDIEMAPTLTIATTGVDNAKSVGNAMMTLKTPMTAYFDAPEYQIASPSTPMPYVGALDYALTSPMKADPNADSVNITGPASPEPFIESSAISFEDFENLKWRLGDDDAKAVVAYFDPDEKLTPRPKMKLQPMHDSRDRALAHEILEKIYGDRLIHETERLTDEMHLWVPGSKVPNWLRKLHEYRSKRPLNKAKADTATNHTASSIKKTFRRNSNKTSFHKKSASNGYNGAAAVRAPRAAPTLENMNSVWLDFAVSAPKKYADDIEKAETAPRPSVPVPEQKINETFKPSKNSSKAIEEAAPAPAPERKSALPPHLRKQAEATEAA